MRSGALPYLAAVGAVIGALVFRFALAGWFGPNVPYLQFFPAVLAAAWYGGLGPGILATTLSALAAMYLFLPPDDLPVGDRADQLSLGLFVASGLAIAWINHRLRTAAVLAASRAERLDAIINTTVDGIIVISARGIIEEFNAGAERLFGYPAAEVIGRNVSVLMPSPDHERHDGYLQHYLTTGDAKIIGTGRKVTGRRRDGSVFPLSLAVGEMTLGGERKFTGVLHDLSERARLEGALGTSEARWRAVVDSAVDGIVVIDANSRIEAFNPAAERLFGYEEREVMGRNVDMLMPSPYRDEHDSYLSRYLASGRAKIIGIGREVTGLRKDGTTFPLHLSVGQMTIAGERKFTGILHDLSARVKMEEQLREQSALGKLGEMVAVMAHEIKNPLAGIRGAVQVIQKRMPPEARETAVLQEIVTRIDSLDGMMKDLLLFSRPPVPRRVPTDIVPLIATIVNLLATDPSFQGVVVEVDGGVPPVPADADLLKIVFQNLLINSAQAMEGHGRIRVRLNAVDTACHIAFIDTGPGIPSDIRDKIFTPFFTTKRKGSGLGLPTVKRLVESHHGQISIDCPPAGGTTVLVRLPLGMS